MIQNKYAHDNIIIAIVSIRIKVRNSDDSIRYKHDTPRRGFIKLYGTVDIKTMTVTNIIITDEGTHDSKHLIDLVDKSGRNNTVSCVLVEDAYNMITIFEYLYHDGCDVTQGLLYNSRMVLT